MPSHTAESRIAHAIGETARQSKRARRAEEVRLRQRVLLVELIAGAMFELRIPFSELKAAQRNLAQGARASGHADSTSTGSVARPAR